MDFKWDEDESMLDYGIPIPMGNTTIPKKETGIQNWDPNSILDNLSFLEEKIHQLQDLVHIVVGQQQANEIVAQQQQLISADLTSVIAQLISTATSLLPSVNMASSTRGKQIENDNNFGNHHDHDQEEDVDESENLLPGSYEILQLEKDEILAPHTHFCTICGKGFKRDANLRMHMRGHGDEYKTAAALAKPAKEATTSSEPILIKRYSCPFTGCKRNKNHKKFQPLKTILCVKNHYKRTHCDKSFICSRCKSKRFSVLADLKTHEKHCGKDKWLCSCGTTFSRKDKLFGHITLFKGHTPAIPVEEASSSKVSTDKRDCSETTKKEGNISFNFNSNATIDDHTVCFSPLSFGTSSFGEFNEFPHPPFDQSDSSYSFLVAGQCSYRRKTGAELKFSSAT